jgi:organic radical activating enzyme
VFNKSDFDWAEKYAKMVAPDCKLYLQPEWEKRAAVEPLMIDYVKNNPQWRMSVQTHKYLDIP